MKLYAKDILKFEELSVTLDSPVSLVVGPNSAGKSCFAAILAAVSAHNANPLNFSGAARGLYVRDGAAEGMAEMNGVQWRPGSGMEWPTDQEPTSSIEAAGLVDFVRRASIPSVRADTWKNMFKSESSRELLEPVWMLGSRQLEKTIEIIDDRGWKNAEKIYIDQRRAAKQKWKNITGQDFGQKKAMAWRPDGWQPELDGASESDLTDTLSEARANRDAATVTHAVSEAEIDTARKVRDEEIPALEAKIAEATRERAEAMKNKREAEVKLEKGIDEKRNVEVRGEKAHKALEAEPPLECPVCQSGLRMQRGVGLQRWRALTAEETKRAKEVIKEGAWQLEGIETQIMVAKGNVNDSSEIVRVTQMALRDVEADLRSARSRARMADMEPQRETHPGVLQALQRQVETASRELEAWRANRSAQEQVESVTQLEEVISLLGPNGPRAAAIRKGITTINAVLQRVEAISGWKPLNLSRDYQLFSGGRPIQAVAKNEQLKAQWSLQIACAIIQGVQWVILDETDTLREKAWDGLVKVIDAISKGMPDLRFVLCATRGVPEPEGWARVELE